jgi:hypothetical protein
MTTPTHELRIPPHFIEPKTLAQLTEQEQVELLEGIRARRMLAVSQYLAMQEEKKKVKEEGMQIKYEKLSIKISKHIDKIDKELEKVVEAFTKLKVLRLEAFDTI